MMIILEVDKIQNSLDQIYDALNYSAESTKVIGENIRESAFIEEYKRQRMIMDETLDQAQKIKSKMENQGKSLVSLIVWGPEEVEKNEKTEKDSSSVLTIETEDKKIEGFFDKLVKLYYSFLDKVKLGLHYLALALIMLAFISLVSFLISGGKFHIFIRSVSDIFENVFKFLKNVFYSVFKGVVTLSPATLMDELANHYEKMIKKLSEAFKKMRAAGINESAFGIVMGLSVGGFIVGHLYIQKELYGES